MAEGAELVARTALLDAAVAFCCARPQSGARDVLVGRIADALRVFDDMLGGPHDAASVKAGVALLDSPIMPVIAAARLTVADWPRLGAGPVRPSHDALSDALSIFFSGRSDQSIGRLPGARHAPAA